MITLGRILNMPHNPIVTNNIKEKYIINLNDPSYNLQVETSTNLTQEAMNFHNSLFRYPICLQDKY